MTTVHDRPVQGASDWPRPGNGAPAGPGGAGDPEQPPRGPWRRRRRLVLAAALAALALAAGGGTLVAMRPATPVTLTSAQIAAKVDPALVDVTATLGYQHSTSAGTGMVLTSSGLVRTNNPATEGAPSNTATDVGDHHTYRAVVAGYSEQRDIAVLRLQNASGLKTVTMGDSAAVRVGDRVVALGNAGGKGGEPAVASGKVVALGQSATATDGASGNSEHLTNLIRSTVGIEPGYSGGPLLNTAGQVIGMNTAGSVSDQMQQGRAHTQAYAIPSNQANAVAGQISAGKSSASVHVGATAFLGVGLLPSHPASGAAVAQVQPGSPAAGTGLVTGDVITSLAGHAITSPADIRDALVPHHPGDTVSLGWTGQAGQQHTATVILATGPAG